MRRIKLLVPIFIVSLLMTKNVLAQQANATMTVLPANSGQVAVNEILSLQITVGNTGTDGYGVGRLRPTVTVPASVTFLATGLQDGLPTGWTVLTNTGSQIRFCNSSDPLGSTQSRTIFLKVRAGNVITPPQTFLGQINFGNGACANGPATPGGNNTADDAPTSTIEVVAAPVPLTLTSFDAALNNCEPLLKWATESEVNTAYFEIQRAVSDNNSVWTTLGKVTAAGNSPRASYSFTDKNILTTGSKFLYRLKLVDRDGAYKYSNTSVVTFTCTTKTITVFPNPVEDGRINVKVLGYSENTNGVLINAAGQALKKFILRNGNNQLLVSEFPAGFYILKVGEGAENMTTVKILIKK